MGESGLTVDWTELVGIDQAGQLLAEGYPDNDEPVDSADQLGSWLSVGPAIQLTSLANRLVETGPGGNCEVRYEGNWERLCVVKGRPWATAETAGSMGREEETQTQRLTGQHGRPTHEYPVASLSSGLQSSGPCYCLLNAGRPTADRSAARHDRVQGVGGALDGSPVKSCMDSAHLSGGQELAVCRDAVSC
ncbi:unnamed protein product [Protopolystoma xenopodis]|uniref:Uncharacterized protein n=1 Tax=Protopolystoma xenopodis TaxID=117903 RepID=A0A448XH31_9PLAT|nr:unnamed protein product [Protopolystoma xenopodis]